MEALADEYRLLAPDTPGQPGKTTARTTDDGRWLVALLDALGIEGVPAVGISHGAGVLLDAVVRVPDRFESVSLVVPASFGTGSPLGLARVRDPSARLSVLAAALAARPCALLANDRPTGIAPARRPRHHRDRPPNYRPHDRVPRPGTRGASNHRTTCARCGRGRRPVLSRSNDGLASGRLSRRAGTSSLSPTNGISSVRWGGRGCAARSARFSRNHRRDRATIPKASLAFVLGTTDDGTLFLTSDERRGPGGPRPTTSGGPRRLPPARRRRRRRTPDETRQRRTPRDAHHVRRRLPDTARWAATCTAPDSAPATPCSSQPLFDAESGEPLALLDGASMNPFKTGAAGAVGVDALARADAANVAVIGSGAQARGQLRRTATVRDLETVWVYSPTKENREDFAARDERGPRRVCRRGRLQRRGRRGRGRRHHRDELRRTRLRR